MVTKFQQPNIGQKSYIERRISSINNKASELKENDNDFRKTRRNTRLVLNESKTEEQFYKKLIKEYIHKGKERVNKLVKKDEEKESEQIKEILLSAKTKYGIETEIIEPLFKIIDEKVSMSLEFVERIMKICKILKVRKLEDLKENEENIKFLLCPF